MTENNSQGLHKAPRSPCLVQMKQKFLGRAHIAVNQFCFMTSFELPKETWDP